MIFKFFYLLFEYFDLFGVMLLLDCAYHWALSIELRLWEVRNSLELFFFWEFCVIRFLDGCFALWRDTEELKFAFHDVLWHFIGLKLVFHILDFLSDGFDLILMSLGWNEYVWFKLITLLIDILSLLFK